MAYMCPPLALQPVTHVLVSPACIDFYARPEAIRRLPPHCQSCTTQTSIWSTFWLPVVLVCRDPDNGKKMVWAGGVPSLLEVLHEGRS